MFRRLLNLLTALSLLLCIVTAVIWVRSFDKGMSARLRWCDVSSRSGYLFLSGPTDTPGEASYRCLGFSFIRTHHTYSAAWIAGAPVWPFLVAATTLPLIRWRAYGKQLRMNAPRRCRSCGYDLTGNVSGVCPECGVAR